jgi:hypothetical protein
MSNCSAASGLFTIARLGETSSEPNSDCGKEGSGNTRGLWFDAYDDTLWQSFQGRALKLFERLYPERLLRTLLQQVLYSVSSADQVGSGVARRNQTMENRGLRATSETKKASSGGRLKNLRQEPWSKLLA